MVLEQEKQGLLGDLQHITVEKKQQEKFEATITSLQKQEKRTQGILKEPKISLPMIQFDGARSQSRGFLN